MKETGLVKDEGILRVGKKRPKDDECFWGEDMSKNNALKKPEVEYSTGVGQRFVTFKGKTIWVNQHEGET